jgi:hypothetical protein
MDNETTLQAPAAPAPIAESWADTDWFQEWLRLARRDYQGHPETPPEFSEAA